MNRNHYYHAFIWPSWRKSGTDCYFSSGARSSRSTSSSSVHERWLSKSYGCVFIQELPRDTNKEDFVWTELGTHVTKRELKYQRFVQKMQLLKKQKREKRAAEQ